jgi:hypothetical protein
MEIDAKMNLGGVSNPTPAKRTSPAATPAQDTDGDSFASSDSLIAALKNAPDVRADAVARGRAAVATDGYPPPDVVKKLSNFLANKLQSNNE